MDALGSRRMPTIMLSIGVDLGQKRDPTAVAVLEVQHHPDGRVHFTCRFLERLALGTPYPDVVRRVAAIQQNAAVRARQAVMDTTFTDAQVTVTTAIDATGVGQPVADLFREAGLPVVSCYFTHGDRRTEANGQVTIGKAWLVSRLQALMQGDRLHLPASHPEARALTRELLDYEIRIDENANDKYGAFRVGTHDDLVTALGLAVGPGDSMRGFGISSWLPDGNDDDDDDARAWLQ